jgi:hypothetical protein
MMPQPLVPAAKIRMVAAPVPPASEKIEDLLAVLHERLRFGKVCMGRPVLDRETVAIRIDLADDPPRAPGDLGHHVGAEPLDDLVERALHRLH